MKKFLKKGFTLVELVVCVVVIAVLTGIAVAAYAGVQNRAKSAADDAVITQINTQLALNETEEGKNKTCYDAIMDVEEIGFNMEKLVPSTKNCQFVWDQDNDRFAVIDEEMNIVSQEQKTSFTKDLTRRWIIASSYFSTDYSIYLMQGNKDTSLAITSGLDVGKNTNVSSITYSNAGAAKNLTIRTNGQMSTLNLNGKGGDAGDTINHYGYANQVNVNSVGNKDCYHEWGTASELVGKAGKIVVESVGNVFEMKKAADAATDSNAPVFTNEGGNVLSSEAGTLSEEATSTTEYSINDYEQLCSFRDATNSGLTFAGITVNLNCDIELPEAWKPISNYYRKTNSKGGLNEAFAGTFNGNNYTISGLTNVGLTASSLNTGYNNTTPQGGVEYVYGFFASVNNAVIKNLKFTNVNITNVDGLLGDCSAACVGMINVSNTDSTKVQLENISVKGNISGYDNVAGVVGMARNVTDTGNAQNHYFTVKGCSFDGTLTAIRRSAAIVAQLSSSVYEAKLENCSAKGTASSNRNADSDKSNISSYYICGGLATWGQTKQLLVVGCSSEMQTSSVMDARDSGVANDNFIMAEISTGNVAKDYTNNHVTTNGHYKKDASYHVVAIVD